MLFPINRFIVLIVKYGKYFIIDKWYLICMKYNFYPNYKYPTVNKKSNLNNF